MLDNLTVNICDDTTLTSQATKITNTKIQYSLSSRIQIHHIL